MKRSILWSVRTTSKNIGLCLVISRTNLAAIWSQAAWTHPWSASLISSLSDLFLLKVKDFVFFNLWCDQETGKQTHYNMQSERKRKNWYAFFPLEIRLCRIKAHTRFIFLTSRACSITAGFGKTWYQRRKSPALLLLVHGLAMLLGWLWQC